MVVACHDCDPLDILRDGSQVACDDGGANALVVRSPNADQAGRAWLASGFQVASRARIVDDNPLGPRKTAPEPRFGGCAAAR